MKKGCFLALLFWALLAAGYWYWLRDRLPAPANAWVSVGAGFFMFVVLGSIRGAFTSAAEARRLRRTMEPGGFMAVDEPKDGETLTVFGTIRPLGEALVAPFSHKRAVLYSYEIEHYESRINSRSQTIKDYTGFALTPSVIDTHRGAIKLLAYPQLEGVDKECPIGQDSIANASEYIRKTNWTPMEGLNIAAMYREAKEMLTDDDGEIRKDLRVHPRDDLNGTTLMEEVLAPGTQVCAVGKWSAERHGIVPDQSVPARLTVGDPRQVLRRLRGKVIASLLGGTILGAAMNAILYFVVTQGRFR